MAIPPISPLQRISLAAFEAAADQLDALPDRSPLDLSPRQVVLGLYDRLALLRDERNYTYAQLAEELEQILGLALSPTTLKAYMRFARIELGRPVRRQGRKKTTVPALPPKSSTQAQVTVSQKVPVKQLATIKPEQRSQPVTASRSQISSSPEAPNRSELPQTVAPLLESGFTPEELDMALTIPDPQDVVAVDRFLQALRYIDDADPARWRQVAAKARNAGINILGTIAIPAQRINQLYNEY